MTEQTCPNPETHGNPFRYCPCGWMEPQSTKPAQEPDQYLNKAKRLAADTYNSGARNGYLITEDMYVVWFCKALGNWKALVSTDVVPGLYFEVTYNGAKQETYVDRYEKTENRAWADDPQ